MISQKIEIALGWWDAALMRFYDVLLFVLARLILVEVTFDEVKKGSRPGGKPANLPEHINPSQARFRHEQQQKASNHTDEKVKQLLTLSVALNAFAVAFARSLGPGILVFLTAFALTSSVFLCIGTLRVRGSAEPDLSDPLIDLGEHQWARDLVLASDQERLAHMYRVDLYRAARRWFLLAFAIALTVISVAPKGSPATTCDPTTQNVVMQEESNTTLHIHPGVVSPASSPTLNAPEDSGRHIVKVPPIAADSIRDTLTK